MKHPRKGVAGKRTGGTARKAIRAKLKCGATIKSIATAAHRSPSTISGIKSGAIKNPPRNLAGNVRRASCKKKKR